MSAFLDSLTNSARSGLESVINTATVAGMDELTKISGRAQEQINNSLLNGSGPNDLEGVAQEAQGGTIYNREFDANKANPSAMSLQTLLILGAVAVLALVLIIKRS